MVFIYFSIFSPFSTNTATSIFTFFLSFKNSTDLRFLFTLFYVSVLSNHFGIIYVQKHIQVFSIPQKTPAYGIYPILVTIEFLFHLYHPNFLKTG